MPGNPYLDDNGQLSIPGLDFIQDPQQDYTVPPALAAPLMPPDFQRALNTLPTGDGGTFGPTPSKPDVLPKGATLSQEASPGSGGYQDVQAAPEPQSVTNPQVPPSGAPGPDAGTVPPVTMPRGVADADQGVVDAANAQMQATVNNASAQFEAQKSDKQRLADAAKASSDNIAQEQVQEHQIRTSFAQKADHDIQHKFQQLQDAENSKEDPKHFWHDQSAFGKVAWIVSLVAGAGSAGADQTRNVGLKMLSEEIDKDMARQRDAIQRRIESAKEGLGLEQNKQARDERFLNDDFSGRMLRLASVGKWLDAQAAIPGNENRKAAMAQMSQDVAGERTKLAVGFSQQKHQEAQFKAQQALEYTKAKMADDRAKAAQEEEKRWHDMENKAKYDTAEMELAKAGLAAGAKGQPEREAIGPQSGVTVVGPNGERFNWAVSKGQGQQATQDIQNFQAWASGLAQLRDKLQSSDWQDRTFNNDNERIAALRQVAEPLLRQLKQRGYTDQSIAAANEYILGENPDSLLSRFKGGGNEDMIKLLDEEIARVPAQARQKLYSYPSNLADAGNEKATLDIDLSDTRLPQVKTPGEDEAIAGAGGKVTPVPRPTNPADYLTLKAQGTLPPLRDELQKVVTKAVDVYKTGSPETNSNVYRASILAINDYEKANKDKPGVKEEAQQARSEVLAESADPSQRARDVLTSIPLEMATEHLDATPANVRDSLARHHVKLTDAEFNDLMDAVKKQEAQAAEEGVGASTPSSLTPIGGV